MISKWPDIKLLVIHYFRHIRAVRMNIKVPVNVPSPRVRWATPHRRERCSLPCLQAEEILHTPYGTEPSCSLMPPPADRTPASLGSPAHRNWSISTTLLTPNWRIQKEHCSKSGELQNDEIIGSVHNQLSIFYIKYLVDLRFFKCAVYNKAHWVTLYCCPCYTCSHYSNYYKPCIITSN